MRVHLYIAVTDERLDFVKSRRVDDNPDCDIVDFYGNWFHVLHVAKINNYHVLEFTNWDQRWTIRRLYRFLKRQNFSGVIGPCTLKQLQVEYPQFVQRYLTDGSYDDNGDWVPGPNIVPRRQIFGDPHPAIQGQWEYDPTQQEIEIDEIENETDVNEND